MSNYTIYLPMTVWQALAFLRNPEDVFARMQDRKQASRPPAVGELHFGSKMVGYHTHADACRTWNRRGAAGELAIVHIEYGALLHERMIREGKIKGSVVHRRSGARLWTVTPAGCADLLSGGARFSMEIVREKSL